MCATLVHRPTSVYDLPLSVKVRVLRPEEVILRFPHGKSVDIGALCFLVRDFATDSIRGRSRPQAVGRKVCIDSLSKTRVTQTRKLIEYCSMMVDTSGLRPETLYSSFSRFIAFMSWADLHGWSDVLAGESAARRALHAYINYLRERVQTNTLTNNSGARQQLPVIQILEGMLNIVDMARGLNLLRIRPLSSQSTPLPNETALMRVLSLCNHLFDALSDLILNHKPYPFSAVMPVHLGLPNDMLWIFPSNIWFMSPSMLAKRETYRAAGWGYNYREGCLATIDQLRKIKDFAGNCDIQRKSVLRNAQLQLIAANSNPQHFQRRQAAIQATNMFIMLFLAQTGMNWAQVTELTWADDFEVATSHQAFRTVKWRAGGKLVSFELPVAFLPKFKRYLEIRKYLLDGIPCTFLFFKQGIKGIGHPRKIKSDQFSVYQMLLRIDPELQPIKSRQWRSAKSDWLIRNTDPATAALVLQNTEKTVLASYAEGSETAHLEEMSTFLGKISSIVVARESVIDSAVPRTVGMCLSYGHPNQSTDASIKPDCKVQEGCLFCDKYKIHADETDTRKLLSCRYCLRITASMMGSEERQQALLGPIFDRIQVIVEEIALRDATMVNKVTHEVDAEGELDAYWARKLEMLIDLGVVA